MLASVPLGQVQELLQDEGGVTWTTTQLLRAWNEAQKVIVVFAPEASLTTASWQLVAAETRHAAPSGAIKIIDVMRNMGADGATPGASIRLTTRGNLEDHVTDWHSGTGAASITQWAPDPRNPKLFWTYPRVHASTAVFVEGTYSSVPADIDELTDTITVGDEWAAAAVNWCMYRALARDSKRTPVFARADHYLKTFGFLVGGKLSADIKQDPRLREHLDAPPGAGAG
jgi:hypothetical protein